MPKALDSSFKWVTMHCFVVRELSLLPKGRQEMKQFALAYQKREKAACEEAVKKSGLVTADSLLAKVKSEGPIDPSQQTILNVSLDKDCRTMKDEIVKMLPGI